jgi:hypothetical protein
MRLKQQIYDFRITQNDLESYKSGGIIEHSIYRHVSKGGASLLPGQMSNSNIYLSAVPPSYGGNMKDVVEVIGMDILPSALHKIAENVDNKIARNILRNVGHFAPAATRFISGFIPGESRRNKKSTYEHENNFSFAPKREITYKNKNAIKHNPRNAIEHHPKNAIEHHPKNAIEYHSSNVPALEYKGHGNTRAKQAYKKFLEEKKQLSKHKGGSIRYD